MDKLECLKISDIGQSAAKPLIEERSTTIPKGSTPKIIRRKKVAYPVIYKIVNTNNNKIYIGSASYYDIRKGTHIAKLRRNKHNNPYLQAAWNKYGESCFRFEILELVSDVNYLLKREQFYIDSLNPEYNISRIAGSNLGLRMSESTKQKISLSSRGIPKPKEFVERLKLILTEVSGKVV